MKIYLTSYQSLKYLNNYFEKLDRDFLNSQPFLKILISASVLRNFSSKSLMEFERNSYYLDALNLTHIPSKKDLIQFIESGNTSGMENLSHLLLPSEFGGGDLYKDNLINFLLEIGIEKLKIPNTLVNMVCKLSSLCISFLISKNLCPELSNSALLDKDFEIKFNTNGYVIIKNAINTDVIKLAKKELKKIKDYEIKNNISHLYGENFKFQRVYNLLDKSDIFLEIINTPIISEAMELIFDRPTLHDKFYLSSFQSNTLFPGAVDQIWHIDANVPPPIPDWTMRVQTAILLDEFNTINGGTELLPQSHKLLRHPSGSETIDKDSIIKVEAEPGSIVFWHGNTWHRSTANNDTNERNALLACFSTSFFREVCLEENHFRIISKERIDKMPENTKRILGYYHGVKRGVNSYI